MFFFSVSIACGTELAGNKLGAVIIAASAASSFLGKVVEGCFDGVDKGMSEVTKRASTTTAALRRRVTATSIASSRLPAWLGVVGVEGGQSAHGDSVLARCCEVLIVLFLDALSAACILPRC